MADVLNRTINVKLNQAVKLVMKNYLPSNQIQEAFNVLFSFMDSMFLNNDLKKIIFLNLKKSRMFLPLLQKILVKLMNIFRIRIPRFKLGNLIQFLLQFPIELKSKFFGSLLSFLSTQGKLSKTFSLLLSKTVLRTSRALTQIQVKFLAAVKKAKTNIESVLVEGVITSVLKAAFKPIFLLLKLVFSLLQKILKPFIKFLWSPVYSLVKMLKVEFQRSGLDKVPLIGTGLAGSFALFGFFPLAGFFLALSVVTGAMKTFFTQADIADKTLKGTLVGSFVLQGNMSGAVSYVMEMFGMGSIDDMKRDLQKALTSTMEELDQI